MASSHDLYDNSEPNIFSQMCEVSSGKYEPHIHTDKALSVTNTCDNPHREYLVTCKDVQIQEFIDDAGGLPFEADLHPVNNDLPSYIPILDKRTAFMSGFLVPNGVETVGLTLIDIVRKGVTLKNGTYQEVGEIEFRRSITLGEAIKGKRVILFSSGSDVLIERLWRESETYSLFESIRAMGFSLVTGINFSVIRGECALGQYINQRKSLLSTYMAQQAGSPAVPHVYCIDRHDVEMWGNYFAKNPQVNLVSMNCQLQKKREDIDAVVKSVSALMERFPYIHFILTGFRLNQMHRFGSHLQRIHFAEKMPVKYGQSRRKLFLNLTTMKFKKARVHEAVEDVIKHNINQRRIYIELVKQQVLEKYKIPDEIALLIESSFPTQETA